MNFLLSDGNNLFVFNDGSHRNDVYYLQRRKLYGHAFLVATISSGLSDEQWTILPQNRLLVLTRGEVLVFGDRLQLIAIDLNSKNKILQNERVLSNG